MVEPVFNNHIIEKLFIQQQDLSKEYSIKSNEVREIIKQGDWFIVSKSGGLIAINQKYVVRVDLKES